MIADGWMDDGVDKRGKERQLQLEGRDWYDNDGKYRNYIRIIATKDGFHFACRKSIIAKYAQSI